MKGHWLKTNNIGARPVVYVVKGTAEEIADYLDSKIVDGVNYARYLQAPYNDSAKINETPSPYPVLYEYEDCGKVVSIDWRDNAENAKLSGYRCKMTSEQRAINRAVKEIVKEKFLASLSARGFSATSEEDSKEEGFTANSAANMEQAPAQKPTTSRGRGRRELKD
jgi:hypothetical protein